MVHLNSSFNLHIVAEDAEETPYLFFQLLRSNEPLN